MSFFLFPGQGSQKPGMGRDFHEDSPEARAVFDEAEALLGPQFLHTIFEGEAAILNQTTWAQPSLLTVEVAIARHCIARGLRPSGCAGHSLGEIPALVIAGVLEFGDALRLTRERARLMSENVPEGGMAAVMGLEPEQIEAALPENVQVANYNGPSQTIISGSRAGIEAAMESLKSAGAKRVLPLAVSGPFHSQYMRPAAEAFQAVLAEVAFQAPAITFVSSVTGGPLSELASIRTILAEQLYSPVRWTQVMAQVPGPAAYEVGPGNVLKGLAKRIEGAPEVHPLGTLEESRSAISA